MMLRRVARTWAFARIVASTLLAYARIAHFIVSERMWRLPPRPRHLPGSTFNPSSETSP